MGRDVSQIRNHAAIKSVEKGDIDAAYRFAKGISDPRDQVRALCRIAMKSFEKRDLQRANELINIEVINQIHSAKSQTDRMEFIVDSATFDESLGVLSRVDFQRALKLSLAINQNAVSAMAQLSVCRGALIEPK